MRSVQLKRLTRSPFFEETIPTGAYEVSYAQIKRLTTFPFFVETKARFRQSKHQGLAGVRQMLYGLPGNPGSHGGVLAELRGVTIQDPGATSGIGVPIC